ncbi:hypothetical protein J4Q44_G00283220 [Coregonus suidteri]|uniref:Uncharacterized protein n=1 Tax=Coregonus suidteri TaxID=861788 RepID=A0AAN8L3B3_9TELE
MRIGGVLPDWVTDEEDTTSSPGAEEREKARGVVWFIQVNTSNLDHREASAELSRHPARLQAPDRSTCVVVSSMSATRWWEAANAVSTVDRARRSEDA